MHFFMRAGGKFMASALWGAGLSWLRSISGGALANGPRLTGAVARQAVTPRAGLIRFCVVTWPMRR